MNERDKIINERANIIDIIKRWRCAQSRDINGHTIWLIDDNERLADALLANGIGDVAEWKKRAEVTERALEYAVSEYRCDECPCIDCNAEIRGSQECVNLIAKTYKEEAERDIKREIEEEENNGEKKKV